ncbi:TPA: hypothetical protein NPN74_005231 [Klebsiella quasipneumoniae subsp. quasipneumoniae]|nr:hypothetical protein [Klebsiella quasipneumoniae subsp. quasipneumoniae]
MFIPVWLIIVFILLFASLLFADRYNAIRRVEAMELLNDRRERIVELIDCIEKLGDDLQKDFCEISDRIFQNNINRSDTPQKESIKDLIALRQQIYRMQDTYREKVREIKR